MPTNAKIFAGPSSGLNMDNIIQVAKSYRNVDIVKQFNAGRIEDRIHISTVGARICRSIAEMAKRHGRNKQELNAEFQAERVNNGVAGRNQHTTADPQKRKRSANEAAEGGKSSSERDGRPSKAAKMDAASTAATNGGQGWNTQIASQAGPSRPLKRKDSRASGEASSSEDSPAGERAPTPSPRKRRHVSDSEESATTIVDSEDRPAPCERVREFERLLDEGEADAFLSDPATTSDDVVWDLAGRLTVAGMVRRANRGAGFRRHTIPAVTGRIRRAVASRAERRGTRVYRMETQLDQRRAENGIERGGVRRQS